MIRFENITKEYEKFTPIKNLNGVIPDNKIVSIIGPSGTGKSTLLRMINGLETPTSGDIYYNDIHVNSSSCDLHALRKDIGMVFQDYSLFNHLTVLENLVVPQMDILRVSKKEARDKAMDLLKLVELEKTTNMKPCNLSGGQRQRIALIRGLALNPKVLLEDEPTSALDPVIVERFAKVLRKESEGKRTVVVVTHDMTYAKAISDIIFYLDEGGIYEQGTPDQIFNHPQKEKTKEFVARNKIFEKIVFTGNINLHDIDKEIENFVTKEKLSLDQMQNICTVFEELVVESIAKTNLDSSLRFLAYVDAKTKNLMYKVTYSGNEYNPFDNDTLSTRILSGCTRVIDYNYIKDDEFPNALTLEMSL